MAAQPATMEIEPVDSTEPLSLTPPGLTLPEDNQPLQDTAPLTLGDGSIPYSLSPQTIASRSFKVAYGSTNTIAPRDPQTVTGALNNGQEEDLRLDQASKQNNDTTQKKTNFVAQAIAQKQGPLTEEDLKWINGTPAFNTYFDPSSVFEVNYANQYTSELDKFATKLDSTNAWNVLQSFPNNDVDAMKQFGSITMAQHEYMLSKLQNLQAQIDQSGYAKFGLNWLENNFPFLNPYWEYQARGNAGASFLEGVSGAGNFEAQRNNLIGLPFNEFTKTIDATVEQMTHGIAGGNPQLAAAWLTTMMGQSTADKILNTLNTIGTVADGLGVIKAGSVAFRGAAVANNLRKAVATMNEAALIDPEMNKAKILASAGDLNSAANMNASQYLINKITGSLDPTKEALDQLPRYMRADIANIERDPGSLTQAQTSALIEQTNASQNKILATLADIVRSTRIPLQNATQDVLDGIYKATFDRYPGMSNAILRQSDIYLEPISNTYHVDAWIGKKAGEFFGSEDEALQYARAHGISVVYNEDQIANLKTRIADLAHEVKNVDMNADTAGLNRHFDAEKQLADLKLQLQEAEASKSGGRVNSAPKTLSPDQIAKKTQIAERIKSIKDELGTAPDMEADTTGLNRYYALQDELRTLEGEHGAIDQQGLGYFIRVTKPINEADDTVRKFIFNEQRAEARTPNTWTQRLPFINYFRSAEDTFSAEHRAMRKSAIYSQHKLLEIAHQEAAYIQDLARGKFFRKTEFNRFNELLKYAQDAKDENGLPGKFFDTPAQLQDHYLRTYGEGISWKQQQAYFAVKRWSEYDLMLRELGLYRGKSRLGAETHTLVTKDAQGNTVRSVKFDGIQRQKFPGGKGEVSGMPSTGNVLFLGDDLQGTKLKSLNRFSVKAKQDLDKLVKEGKLKIVQLWDSEATPLKDMGFEDAGKTVDYVIAPGHQIQTEPLTWQQLPFRGGGHFAYDYTHYVKQAIVHRETVDGVTSLRYRGDRTVVPFNGKTMGKDFADKMNAVRELIKANKMDAAQAIAVKHLPFEWNELKSKFMPTRDANGVTHPPVFDPHEPFQVVPRNTTIADMSKDLYDRIKNDSKGNFIDDTKHSLARNFQIEFTGERDAENLSTVSMSGSRANPVFNWRPAEKISPLEIMNRSMGSIIRSTFFDDYKTYAVESWLREAQKYMKARPSEIASSPFYFFKTASKDSFLSGIAKDDPGKIQNLLSNKFKIEQLVGTPSTLDTFLHSLAQSTYDAAYSRFGATADKLVPMWLVHKLRDPFAFMRTMTYHAFLGFGYLPQMFIQMASFVPMFAMAPRYAITGSFGTLLHAYSSLNKNIEILDHLDSLAVKLGSITPGFPKWKPGEWKEAMQALDRSGFGHVGGEYGPLSQLHYAKPLTSGTQDALTLGTLPFRAGEKATRTGAWYMAFKEFRDANPVGKITRGDLEKILDRADYYYGNMSSASHSALNSGILSLPTQFYNYAARQAEIFWSGTGRTGETVTERNLLRARLLAVNSAVFGVPMGFGAAGLPIADWMRREMLDSADDRYNQRSALNPMRYLAYGARSITGTTAPYNTATANITGSTKDWIEHFFMEGYPQTQVAMITGKNYNFGPRYGLQGLTQYRDALLGDAPFWQIVTGASGSFFGNTLGPDKDGMIQAMRAIVQGNTDKFPVKVDDLIDMFKEIQTVNKGWGLYVALNTGKWINKNSAYLTDVNKLNALFMTVTGLQPSAQADNYNISQNLKAQQAMVKYGLQRFQQEMDRGLIASGNSDYEQATQYYTRAMAWGQLFNIPNDELSKALARSFKGRESLIDRIAWERYVDKAPDAQKEAYRKTFSDIHNQLKKDKQ